MGTKKLAAELGLLRQRSSSGPKKLLVSNQIFSYIIVIDFESTCWREKNNYGQEIIEFPAVLLNTSTGELESEFHSYVQPQEHPTLSDFCTELTGITQAQVEAGLPLQICLSRFSRWIQALQHQKGLVFPNRPRPAPPSTAATKLCTFLTWSDWDLGVCLQYECKRKQINKPSVLNSWIDLRSTYRLFYNRKPKGLNGALQDLGIQFEGREHSGLDDARNTALLAARMTREGCVLRITRSLDRMPITRPKAPPETKKPAEHDKSMDANGKSSTFMNFVKPGFNKQSQTSQTKNSVQSLVSPKTLLNGTIITSTTSSSSLSTVTVNVASADTTDLVPFLQPDTTENPFVELIADGEDRCGSYDDVLLDDRTDDYSESESASHTFESSIHPLDLFVNGNKIKESNINSVKPGLKTSFAVPKTLLKSKVCTTLSSSTSKFVTANRNLPKPQVLVSNTPMLQKPSKQSFTVFSEREDPCSSASITSRSVLSNLSINTSLNRTWLGADGKRQSRITSPLCLCGRRAKRQCVSNGGPNQGRTFFCCPGRRSGGRAQGVCGFFKWESALFGANSAATVDKGELQRSLRNSFGMVCSFNKK